MSQHMEHGRRMLRWLGDAKGRPGTPVGVTWGVPWLEGELQRDDPVSLTGESGEAIPLQTWPTAYWPDGSVKWSAHAASLTGEPSQAYLLSKVKRETAVHPARHLSVTDKGDWLEIDTGTIVCQLNKAGESLIRSIYRGKSLVCSDGRLRCILEEQQGEPGRRTTSEQDYTSRIHQVVMEQSGPVRAVARVEGTHRLSSGGKEWLPFTVRLYFYAGQHSIRALHTFVYDGDPQQDFIKGMGIAFAVPLQGPLYNRHLRMAGDTGLFSESSKHLMTTRTLGKYQELYKRQTAGEAIAFDPHEDAHFIGLIEESAVWDHFKLVQHAADSYTISKRTGPGCSWLKAAAGNRARGLVYAGGENGGLAAGVRNFWRKFPSSLEVEHLSAANAAMTLWFWSPDAAPMDLRHYDTATHVQSSYEGFDELRSTPYGIANSSELTLWCLDQTPSHEELNAFTELCQSPPLLVCAPEAYHQARAFGLWSLPDRSTPAKAAIEEQLDAISSFYQREIEQRKWYGFWDYGDVMHSYDAVRHTWRYDIGGCAWQNTELVPNMWLWLMFLRTGRRDLFELAEAMTRHTSEVDIYHLGEYAGLGSRHNVIHWGCGCKEARISMAGLHRYYYYLTADERIGDIMNEVVDADYATVHLDPMRSYYPKDEYPTHARVGPDWAAFVSNWMTRWERYEDTVYRDKLLAGIDSLKRMPNRMRNLTVHGYDPETGRLYDMGVNAGGHLAICMGGPQVWFELSRLLGDPQWDEMLAEIGAFYHLPREEKAKLLVGEMPEGGYAWPMFSTGITAYAARHYGDAALAERAWTILLQDDRLGSSDLKLEEIPVPGLEYVRAISEIPWISTNTASQWSLNAMICLELIDSFLPSSGLQEPKTDQL